MYYWFLSLVATLTNSGATTQIEFSADPGLIFMIDPFKMHACLRLASGLDGIQPPLQQGK